jgi:DNA-binding beta-propeller fold protein YncE
MFNGPNRVLISKDEKFLYVTDRDLRSNSSVMKIDLEGNLISVFKESGYAVPYGLQQLEDETILVCFQDRGTVLRLTSSLKRCDLIGPEKENMYRPKAITYRNIYHKLYVSCSSEKGKRNADIVKVFNVKWI